MNITDQAHAVSLVIGSGGRNNDAEPGRYYIDHADVQGEHCMPCWLGADDDDAPNPMPCLLTTGQPLTVGTLVQTLPALRWHRVPSRTAVVLMEARAHALVWFWGLGAPEVGRTLYTVEAAEVAPMVTTLSTLPAPAFAALHNAAATAHATTHPGLMSPLMSRLTAVHGS